MKYLRTVEGGFAVGIPLTLPFYWISTDREIEWAVRALPLIMICYILGQGALYWRLKYRQYAYAEALPAWMPATFRVFRCSNVLGLAAATLGLTIAVAHGIARTDLLWGAGLLAFAVLEHVNYYHYQLMYDTAGALRRLRKTRRLRKSALSNDMNTV